MLTGKVLDLQIGLQVVIYNWHRFLKGGRCFSDLEDDDGDDDRDDGGGDDDDDGDSGDYDGGDDDDDGDGGDDDGGDGGEDDVADGGDDNKEMSGGCTHLKAATTLEAETQSLS